MLVLPAPLLATRFRSNGETPVLSVEHSRRRHPDLELSIDQREPRSRLCPRTTELVLLLFAVNPNCLFLIIISGEVGGGGGSRHLGRSLPSNIPLSCKLLPENQLNLQVITRQILNVYV